jgi:riboflavin kinase/FMN adenylyltransferase
MKIYRDIPQMPKVRHAVVTTGTFDGVHPGHRTILNRLRQTAERIGGETVLITFHPHPRTVLQPEYTGLRLLNTMEEKEALLAETGLDNLLIIPFTKEFSQITSEEYIRRILVDTIGTEKLVIGHDHRFGRGRGGSFRELSDLAPEFGFEVEEIPPIEVDGVTVSSSKIRQALLAGDVDAAAEWLGYRYPLTGMVVEGDRLGRTLGFPTANLAIADPLKLIPGDGIYAVYAEAEGKNYRAMLHIGPRRTLDSDDRRIEVNLFDFEGDLYGRAVTLRFVKRLRAELKFDNLERLTEQMKMDKLHTLTIFGEIEK